MPEKKGFDETDPILEINSFIDKEETNIDETDRIIDTMRNDNVFASSEVKPGSSCNNRNN